MFMLKLYNPRGTQFDTLFFKDEDKAKAAADQWRVKDGARYTVGIEAVRYQDGEQEPTLCQHLHRVLSKSCGVKVCDTCGDHAGLARCFCGWSADGTDGRAYLEEAGERIDEDE